MPREMIAEVRKASGWVEPSELRAACEAMQRQDGLSKDHTAEIGDTAK
jgi:tellurite resistance protein